VTAFQKQLSYPDGWGAGHEADIIGTVLALLMMGCGPSQELVAQVQAVDLALQDKARAGEISWIEYAKKTRPCGRSRQPRVPKRRPLSLLGDDCRRDRCGAAHPGEVRLPLEETIGGNPSSGIGKASSRSAIMSTGLMQAGAALSAASRPQVMNCSTTRSLSSLETTCF
jgi:hypothetical protein